MDDNIIIEMFFNRDEKAIAETQKKFGEYIHSIAFNISGTTEDACECENDTYLKLWNSIPPEKPVNFKAYLGRIVRNSALSLYRKNKAVKRDSGVYVLLSELEECLPSKTTTEDEADANYVSSLISSWLRTLSQDDRVLFVRRYWYGDKVKDISDMAGMPSKKISSKLFALRKQLKDELSQKGVNV